MDTTFYLVTHQTRTPSTTKIGIEPQVQRIGKYKSFGDTFNRTSISEAQREVVSSLLMEASDFWADSVAMALNKTAADVMQLWADTGISCNSLSHSVSISSSSY